jgi:hypothetical protein
MIHDQELVRLPHRVPETPGQHMANGIEIERKLNNQVSFIPWTFVVPSFTGGFAQACAAEQIVQNGATDIRYKFVKQQAWTALTIDLFISCYSAVANCAWDLYAVLNPYRPEDQTQDLLLSTTGLLLGRVWTNGVNTRTHAAFSTGPQQVMDPSTGNFLRAGKYAIGLYAVRTTGAGNLQLDGNDGLRLRIYEHPPQPTIV